MAKRRKLEAPDAAALSALETDSERDAQARRARGATAPIAQVAADISSLTALPDPQDVTDAAALRAARDEGRLIAEIPMDQIDPVALVRDRLVMDAAALGELKASIGAGGLRLPIEVYALEAPKGKYRYGLISGYRRHLAMTQLWAETELPRFERIKALVLPRQDTAQAMMQMVEENEVREGLSPYERGRISVLAMHNGAFGSVHEAVDKLFQSASRAKRSKIRSFASVFEELGDLLKHADQLSERQGLRLSNVIRDGGEGALRAALENGGKAGGFDAEWAALEPVVQAVEDKGSPDAQRGGRPKKPPIAGWQGDTLTLASGFTLSRATDGSDQIIRISGRTADAEIGEAAILAIKSILDRP